MKLNEISTTFIYKKMSFKSQLKEALVAQVIEDLMDLGSSDDEDEIEEVLDDFNDNMIAILSHRYCIKNDPVPKSMQWFTEVLPSLDDKRFKSLLRTTRAQFALVLDIIEQSFSIPDPKKLKTPISTQVAIALYRFGSYGDGATTSKVATLFGVGDGGTIHRYTERVINALLSVEKTYVAWPNTEERLLLERRSEDELPLCIGYLDGSEIKLASTPALDHTSYFSRKQQYSIKLQAVCDRDLKIRHVVVGYPGSAHDARIFNNCELAKNESQYFTGAQYLAADSAYKLTNTVLTPFRKNSTFGSSQARKFFNRTFSRYRVRIEHVFGILKTKFPSLKELRIRIKDKRTHTMVCNWVRACIILHNILVPTYDTEDLEYESNEVDEEEIGLSLGEIQEEAVRKRIELFELIVGSNFQI